MLKFTQMNMRSGVLILSLCLFSFCLQAQSNNSDSTSKCSWNWLIPDGAMMQYAGGFGMLSAGIKYDVFKRTEVYLTSGFVPDHYGDIWTLNLIASFSLLRYKPDPRVEINFLKAGAFVNYNNGNNIHLKWPERYFKEYYWWNSAFRWGPLLETELKWKPSNSKLNYSMFIQCSTNDLFIATYRFSSHTIPFTDILVLGTGVRIGFHNP